MRSRVCCPLGAGHVQEVEHRGAGQGEERGDGGGGCRRGGRCGGTRRHAACDAGVLVPRRPPLGRVLPRPAERGGCGSDAERVGVHCGSWAGDGGAGPAGRGRRGRRKRRRLVVFGGRGCGGGCLMRPLLFAARPLLRAADVVFAPQQAGGAPRPRRVESIDDDGSSCP